MPLARLVDDLERLAPGPLPIWRTAVLRRLGDVRDMLVRETPGPCDWLAARRDGAYRERVVLLDRISNQRLQVLGVEDVDRVSYDLRRLVADVRRHLQRVRDLAYDEVEYEVGGSG